MNKMIRLMQNYLLLGLPFVMFCMAWQTFHSSNEIETLGMLWTVLGCNLILWFMTLILFLIVLVIAPNVREKTLIRLANIKERDEREQYITGKAARTTYISMLSLTILLLFFSIFSLKISETQETQGIHHKKLAVNVGLQFGLFQEPVAENNSQEKVLFDSRNIQFSQSAILIILLSCQLLMFNFAARKEQKKDEA